MVKRLAGKIGLAALSLVVSLGLAELVARRFAPPQNLYPFAHRIPHPVLGWSLEPGAEYRYSIDGRDVAVHYNSQGWRDVEHAIPKPPGRVRIVVLGDSFMEAHTVELQDAFARRLEADLLLAGVNAEVINLGVGGYGTLQEALAFQEAGRAYAPDIVLLGMYVANDLENNSEELSPQQAAKNRGARSRPFLDPSDPTVWRTTPIDYQEAARRYAVARAETETLGACVLGESALVQAIARDTGMLAHRGAGGGGRGRNAGRVRLRYGESYCPEPPVYTRAWGTTERILDHLQGEVKAAGGRLVVFSVPALKDTDPSSADPASIRVPAPYRLCLEEGPAYARLGGILSGLGVEYVDLLPAFRAAAGHRSGSSLFAGDLHWTAQGHALAAQNVAAALAERHVLPH